MNIKSLAASALIGVSTLFTGATGAEAATSYCYETNRYDTVCIHGVWKHKTYGGAQKLVEWSVNGGTRYTDEVNCRTASRYNYKKDLAGIACFEFN